MQSKIVDKEIEKKSEYPCLMKSINNGYVVLFTGHSNGIVVFSSFNYPIGHKSSCWDMTCFTFFNGTIELSN